MTILVTCQCGFHKEVPDNWQGMRVKCKCGRSFLIGEEGGIMEPPVAAPPVQDPPAEPTDLPAATKPPLDASATDELQISLGSPSRSISAVYHSRHDRAERRRRIALVCGAMISLACLVALAVVLPRQFPSGWPGQSQTAAAPEAANTATDPTAGKANQPSAVPFADVASAAPTADGEMTAEINHQETDQDANGLSDATGRLQSRIAELIELNADDGLLLTGMFGSEFQQLTITDDQQAKIQELVTQLKSKEEGLADGTIELEPWYADGEKIGHELLAVLTESQQRRLRELIEREKIKRVRFEDYAARLRPELQIPRVSWKIEADGDKLPAIKTCSLSGPAQAGWFRPRAASAIFAVSNLSPSQAGVHLLQFHNLATNQLLGTCEIPQAGLGHTTIVSPDGQYLAVERNRDDGQATIEVWSTQSGTLLASKQIPHSDGKTPTPLYSLRDCAANHVFAISGKGYWIWNIESGATREVEFPDWIAQNLPESALSPGGRYVVVAHPHSPSIDSKHYHFLEICVYELETGDLLGNQILATDYREMRVGAIALSNDGRELALLWDVPDPEPKRMLLHLNAINGDLIRTVVGLPTSLEGYACPHELQQRDLIWLPDKSGWIVNLQKLVESESGAQIDIELPKLEQATPPGPGDPEIIVEAVPAGDGRLLLIIAQRSSDPQPSVQLKTQFMDLPKMGPFM